MDGVAVAALALALLLVLALQLALVLALVLALAGLSVRWSLKGTSLPRSSRTTALGRQGFRHPVHDQVAAVKVERRRGQPGRLADQVRHQVRV